MIPRKIDSYELYTIYAATQYKWKSIGRIMTMSYMNTYFKNST